MSIDPSFAHRRLTVTVMAGLAVAAAMLSGCATTSPGQGALGNSTTGPANTGQPSPTTPAASTPATTSTPTQVHTTPAGPTGPTIVVFKVKQQPTCPVIGTTDAPFSAPGQNIILQWQVTGGATKTALSIDNPSFFKTYQTGNYAEYSTTDSAELPFTCDSSTGPTTTHTYTLDSEGGGATAEKTLTVTAPTNP